uniref:Uncharacterized protein n=1 Tax=Glossina palpalis gambiensis TaxID=67801 RepID=A0A1B0AL34_9MUSC
MLLTLPALGPRSFLFLFVFLDAVIAIVVSPRVVTLCSSSNALADLTVAFTTLSCVPYLGSGISGLVVAALAALFLVVEVIVLAARTSIVAFFVLVGPDSLSTSQDANFFTSIIFCSVVAEGQFPHNAQPRLIAVLLPNQMRLNQTRNLGFVLRIVIRLAMWACFLLPNFTEWPAMVNTAPVFARKSIPRVRWSTFLLTTNSSRLKDISPIFASTVMLRLLSCDAPATIRMVWLLVSEFTMWGISPMKSSRMMLLVAPVSTTPVVARPPMVREATRVLPVISTVFGTASGGGFLRSMDSYTVIPRACICRPAVCRQQSFVRTPGRPQSQQNKTR